MRVQGEYFGLFRQEEADASLSSFLEHIGYFIL